MHVRIQGLTAGATPPSPKAAIGARRPDTVNRAAHALRPAALSPSRDKGYLGAYVRRQRSRLGAPKAVTAAAHKLARIVYNVMRYGVDYAKRSGAEYVAEQRQRLERGLHRRARELGYELVKPDGEVVTRPGPDLLLNA